MYGGALLARTYNMIKISASEARWASYALQSTLMSNTSNLFEADAGFATFSGFDLIAMNTSLNESVTRDAFTTVAEMLM